MKVPYSKILSTKSIEKSIDPDLKLGSSDKKKSKLKFFGVV